MLEKKGGSHTVIITVTITIDVLGCLLPVSPAF